MWNACGRSSLPSRNSRTAAGYDLSGVKFLRAEQHSRNAPAQINGGEMEATRGAARYALGHSSREMERLATQARVFEPFTRRMLQEAGVSEGMRVLDIGSGAGDVALLCAALVGSSGRVIGVDKAETAVSQARARAQAEGFKNVTFS